MARGTEGFYIKDGKRHDADFHADGEDYELDVEEQAAGIKRMIDAGCDPDVAKNMYKGPNRIQLAMGVEEK